MHRALGRMYVDDEWFTAHYDRRASGGRRLAAGGDRGERRALGLSRMS